MQSHHLLLSLWGLASLLVDRVAVVAGAPHLAAGLALGQSVLAGLWIGTGGGSLACRMATGLAVVSFWSRQTGGATLLAALALAAGLAGLGRLAGWQVRQPGEAPSVRRRGWSLGSYCGTMACAVLALSLLVTQVDKVAQGGEAGMAHAARLEPVVLALAVLVVSGSLGVWRVAGFQIERPGGSNRRKPSPFGRGWPKAG